MKKTVMIIWVAIVFAACKNDSDPGLQTDKVVLADSASLNTGNASSDTAKAVQTSGHPVVISKSNSSENDKTSSSGKNSASTANGTTTTTTTKTTTAAKKKGWSSRAKGAVIGGVAGAVGGAVISKHKGTGAAIGGVVGAAGGYIIGNEKDKKNNR